MGRPCNPCPCTSLEIGVKILAALEIVGSIIALIVASVLLYALDNPGAVNSAIEMQALKLGQHGIIIFMMTVILSLAINIGLYYWGAIRKRTDICWIYIVYTAIHMIFNVIFLIMTLAESGNKWNEKPNTMSIINSVFNIILECYIIWVVHSFIMQVRQQQRQSQLLGAAPGLYGGEAGGMPQGSIYRAVEAGNYYAAEQPDYPTLVDQSQPQPTSAPATV
ncbi:unnamed protein product [Orchesella dallaii]|uniref:Uncharacterized protein n=1 Tax=Orchesella dallaii TaxID=48710 RepID=A0ABP1QGL3_9HEXA